MIVVDWVTWQCARCDWNARQTTSQLEAYEAVKAHQASHFAPINNPEFVLKAGTIVHVAGVPVELVSDSYVTTHEDNVPLIVAAGIAVGPA